MLDRLILFLTNPARTTGDNPNIDTLVAIDDGVGSGESSQAWTLLSSEDNRDSSGDGDLNDVYLRGPGLAGADQIYTWIDTLHSDGDDYYNWRLAGMTGYTAGVDIQYQSGVTQGRLPRMLMWNDPIKYWFVGNGRRYIVVAKISSVYECCYMGFCLPYGLPTQFPYPLCIGGSACPTTTASYNRYSSTQNDHRSFMNPYAYFPYSEPGGAITVGTFDTTEYYSTLKVLQGSTWIGLLNKSGSTYSYANNVWPWVCEYNYYYGVGNMFNERLRENIDGSYPIFPAIVNISSPSKSIMGELQGIYATTGFGGLAAEDTFSLGGSTYIAFPCIYNANRSDFFALKLE